MQTIGIMRTRLTALWTARRAQCGVLASLHLAFTSSLTMVAGCRPAASSAMAGAPGAVRPGITVLLDDSLLLIRGKRVGLLTNQTGVDARGVSDIELLRGDRARAAGVTLVRLF